MADSKKIKLIHKVTINFYPKKYRKIKMSSEKIAKNFLKFRIESLESIKPY